MKALKNFFPSQKTESNIDLYCDVLLVYMLIESSLGPCDLMWELGMALDSGKREKLEGAWRSYQNLSDETKDLIQAGDADFEHSVGDEGRKAASLPAARKAAGKSA